jgi:hypothetical protein
VSSFDETWADANPGQPDDDAPADGKHDAALIDASAFTSKNGKDVVKLEFQTVDKDHTWGVIYGFNSVKAAGFTKGQCQAIGVNTEAPDIVSLDALGQALKEHVGEFFEVDVERNGEYVNTYVRGPAAGAVPQSDVPADTGDFETVPASNDDGGDVPF